MTVSNVINQHPYVKASTREKVVKEGLLGKIGLVEIYCYYHMRNNDNPPVSKVPDFFDLFERLDVSRLAPELRVLVGL